MERMQKEVTVLQMRYYPGIWLERLRKTSKTLVRIAGVWSGI
jgi:hypothetical protein